MIDFKRVPSPCFLLDERLLARNLSVVDRVRRESGAEVIVALKACAMWSIFPLLARHSDGATASSAAEARLVREEFGQPCGQREGPTADPPDVRRAGARIPGTAAGRFGSRRRAASVRRGAAGRCSGEVTAPFLLRYENPGLPNG